MEIPFLSTDQMIEVDRLMIEEYEILLIQMMENAGRNLADLSRKRFLAGNPEGKRVVVLAGKGGNGGGGMVCARRLHNWGADVAVYTTAEAHGYAGVPAHQRNILQKMGVPVYAPGADLPAARIDLVIDAVIGYSLAGNPRGAASTQIQWANGQKAPVLSLDTPSGIDTTSGTIHEPAVTADATMTLALPKEGLRQKEVKRMVGELYVADISVPPALYSAPAIEIKINALFSKEEIVRIW